MDKKRTTLVSIVAVTIIGAVLLIAGFLDKVDAGQTTSLYNSDPNLSGSGVVGQVSKIVVDIDSPYGFETLTTFRGFQTDNLMKEGTYTTLRLFGPIMDDKRTLLHWIASDVGKLPDGLTTELPITTGGGKPAKMSKAKEGSTIDKIPLSGKVTLKLLEGYQDAYSTSYARQIEFSGCHVADYHLGTNYDDEKPYFKDGIEHFEEVVFACKNIKDLQGNSMNSRGIMTERAYNDNNRQIMNEKGELIITSREYRQPIVMGNHKQTESINLKPEIATRIELDKTHYEMGDVATFAITFGDLEGNAIDPDTIRAIYDGKMVQLTKQDTGIYTFTTPGLAKAHHQLIVSVDKSGFPTDTTYLSIPIQRVS